MTVNAGKRNVSPELLHELRNPLNQIIGYSEMLAEEPLARDEFLTDLDKIRAAGRRMLAILDQSFATESDVTPLPRSHETLTESPVPPQPAITAAVEPGRILVVDDDAGNRDVLCRRLQRQGHFVEAVGNGRDALSRLRGATFDVVLLDIMMPGMDGYDVLRHIQETDSIRNLPVIVISALSDMQSVVRCIEAGAEDYLTKPFDATLLKARVGASLQKKRGRDREAALFEQLQLNFKRLEELEKLRDDMRNMIVHDLRTPLTSLMVGMEMLDMSGGLTESQKEMLSLSLGGGRTLLGMINDLLDVEKMESGTAQLQYSEVSATAVVASAIEQVAALARDAGTKLVMEIAPALPAFAADEKKISRTLVNLIGNAIKFTGAGTVTVTASRADEAHVRFVVADTGRGIAPEAFEKIFEKFSQLDARNKVGTGLGLAFCRLAVEAHGGRIAVDSKVGAGSSFTFELPISPPPLAA